MKLLKCKKCKSFDGVRIYKLSHRIMCLHCGIDVPWTYENEDKYFE